MKISVNKALQLSGLNRDDLYALIRLGQIPGCCYIKKDGATRGKYLILEPHFTNFIENKKAWAMWPNKTQANIKTMIFIDYNINNI